ncbi:MAG: hypothetical protein PHF21_02675 [Bacilli bacterium]|nr:hypothetical protein [Bacilli bacterium]
METYGAFTNVYKIVARKKDQKRLYKKHEYISEEKYLKHGLEFAKRMLDVNYYNKIEMQVEHYRLDAYDQYILIKIEKNY